MYVFTAKVIPGRGRGSKIGFPTANLDKLDPTIIYGVYAVKVKLGNKFYQALMHYGPKKTFVENISCEVYLKNFKEKIYGRTLEIEVKKRIRDVRKFDDAEALKKQIEKDLLELGNQDIGNIN